jgi:hypothetical protein
MKAAAESRERECDIKSYLRCRTFNELMYDFDKKSKQNIRAIYYIVSTFARPRRNGEGERDFSEALNSEISPMHEFLRWVCSL